MATVQYRVVVGKKDERVEGADDAELVISVAAKDLGIDPTVAFMSGKLKAVGHTGLLLDALRSGEAAAALTRLATS
jgi:hypothetical protein